ncbi:plasmid stabilization protein [Xanthobacter autotrophicus]|uniref:FitA-like ribbon-helix-helix domain-containing protein n=1 Tax=Xanthobacter autotrophicus TaxID=280 RepID=UPI00372B318C
MPAITIRNLSAETHRALKVRAARHGRSTEAEVRDILEQAAKPEGRIRLGSLLAEIGREARLSEKERAIFETAIKRDKTPSEPISFN